MTTTPANRQRDAERARPGQRQLSLGPPPGGRLLKRAGNLFTAAGEPSTPALHDILTSAPASRVGTAYEVSGGTWKGRSPLNSGDGNKSSLGFGVGASLRRTLSEVKNSGLALKRSLSSKRRDAVNGVGSVDTKSRHGRSLSESTYTHTYTQKVDSLRRSTTFATNSLSPGISEASPIDPDSTTSTPPLTPRPRMDAAGRGDADVKVPLLLQEGTPMTKVSAKKKKTVIFRIDPDQGYVLWESKKSGIIPIENIKEIRSGADARYYREQFQLSADYESRWLTLIYIADGRYKTLHAVASTPDAFHLWDRTLRALFAVRQELMSGLGHVETRQSVWEKRYWKGADEQRDDRLCFEEVEKMCRRLNLNYSKADLMSRFEEADTQKRGFLDFNDFRKFVKLLKDRPEITRLYKRLVGDGRLDLGVFENFMQVFQKSTASKQELEVMFRKHAISPSSAELPPTFPPPVHASLTAQQEDAPTPAPSSDITPAPAPTADHDVPEVSAPSTETKAANKPCELSELTMTLEGFTNFLLSTDNSAFSDQSGKVRQDMTRPLPEYYISSSHNTYLVGHQLVGVSTIEGYIRALLHSCRSVEIDIYDGESEPVIYHGKTFTSKVPLRDICQAIAKYAFIASPYPVIISAEVHCSFTQQDLVASIMRSVFGDTLVSAPPDGRPVITQLPSPEELRGRILLKAKNLYTLEHDGIKERTVSVNTESSESSSTSDASASESEAGIGRDVRVELSRELNKARNVDAVKEIREEIQKPIKEFKEELSKARNLYDKVRRKKAPSPASLEHGGLASPPGTPTHQKTASHGSSRGFSDSTLASTSTTSTSVERPRVKMSFELVALLVYTVGVKCRGFNKKETYAPEHVFSLSERTANKVLKQSMIDLIKHNRTHLVRIYPNGTRLSSSNYEPHKYWAAGAQLVAINWQTFDLGYMINHSMFQRNGRAGYVLKPPALRNPNKDLLSKRSNHILDLTIISAQQLPRRKDSEGREIINGSIVDPYVEVSIHVPDWARAPYTTNSSSVTSYLSSASSTALGDTSNTASTTPVPSPSSTARTTIIRTGVVKNNGFNPVWEEILRLPFDCVGDMLDLIFLRIAVRDERDDASDEPLAVYCVSLGSLQQGYRHLPLHDAQLSQYLFSSLFVHINVRDV